MSNEISLNISANVLNGSFTDAWATQKQSKDQASVTGSLGGNWAVATSLTDFPATGTGGYIFLRNLDPTNYLTIGVDVSGTQRTFGRLKPGDEATWRIESGAQLCGTANTAAVNVQYKLWGA